jgi:two-component system sensor histidine kinase PilS (NtrC family)
MTDIKLAHQNTSFRALQIYTLYRFIIALFLLLMFHAQSGELFLGKESPELFHWSSLAYLLSAIAFFFVNQHRLLSFKSLVELQVFLDLVLLTFLMHASGGIATGLGILMAVSVISCNILWF